MNKTYLMLKNNPVLEIDNYTCKILDYQHLPYSLRYQDVNYDDIMHGWTEARSMNIGKTNAKKLLAGLRISQSNSYLIAKICHFASLTDCYWMKDENENIFWEDINLFKNPLEKAISSTTLLGTPLAKINNQKIHTPEVTAQGMAAKAWIRTDSRLCLYKVGKKELAASQILDALNIPHVEYEEVSVDELKRIADETYINKILKAGEKVVKSNIISSEEKSLVTWEEFQMYCSYHDLDEFREIEKIDSEQYHLMQVADYILSNEDRHGANFGFFMDNISGKLGKLYPLMDHDHAFADDPVIFSQTSERTMTLKDAAIDSVNHLNKNVNTSKLLKMKKPEDIDEKQWEQVIANAKEIRLEPVKIELQSNMYNLMKNEIDQIVESKEKR